MSKMQRLLGGILLLCLVLSLGAAVLPMDAAAETVTETSEKIYGYADWGGAKAATFELEVDAKVRITFAYSEGLSSISLVKIGSGTVTPTSVSSGSGNYGDTYKYDKMYYYDLEPGEYSINVFAGAYENTGGTVYWLQIRATYEVHTHDYSYSTKKVAPTCTARGYMKHTCSCGDYYTDNYVDKLPHTEVYAPREAPTCTKTGKDEGTKCSVCGTTISGRTTIPKLPHDTLVEIPGIEPTCTTSGKTAGAKCSTCGTVSLAQEDIPILEHDFVDNTCSFCGLMVGVCGDDLEWMLDSSGTLTITGSGDMYDCEMYGAPWCEASDRIVTIKLPEGLTSIGAFAFQKTAISKITIPDSVQAIGDSAFYCCENLTEITLPNSVSHLDGFVFYGCSALTEVTLPGSLTELPNGLFDGCSTLTNVTIPQGVTTIGDWTFSDCKALTKINIPENVTAIGANAFRNCGNLTYLCIPGDAPTIGYSAFEFVNATIHYNSGSGGWENVVTQNYGGSITWDSLTHQYSKTESVEPTCTEQGTDTYTCICGAMKSETVKVLHETEEICHICKKAGVCGENAYWRYVPSANSASGYGILYINGIGTMKNYSTESVAPWYRYRSDIEEINVGSGITQIGEYAFYGCNMVWGSDLSLPDTLTHINAYAFYGCSKVGDVYLPYGIKHISANAFKDCRSNLLIRYPGTIREWIGISQTTYPVSCSDVRANVYGFCGENAKWYLSTGANLVIFGSGAIKNYGSTSVPWYASRSTVKTVVVEQGITEIGNNAFNKFSSLTSVSLPETVTRIGSGTFDSCTSLRRIVLPDSLNSIGSYAFYDCGVLSRITFEGPAPVIDWTAFYNVKATAYYHSTAPSWTKAVRQNYGGTITWKVMEGCEKISVTDSAVDATCTSSGLTQGSHCSTCGATLVKQEVIPATGHSYGYAVEQEPTLTEVGILKGICEACDGETTVELPMLSEDAYDYAVTAEPTYTETGSATYTWKDTTYGTIVITVVLEKLEILLGDVDGNGTVNTRDRILLTRYLAGWEGYDEEDINLLAADVNQDGTVNTKDRIILTRYLANWTGYEELPYKK